MLRDAEALLDGRIVRPARIVIGGAAMVLARSPARHAGRRRVRGEGRATIAELDVAAKEVARELDVEPDWLNPHFQTYAGVLPPDYSVRLRSVYRGERLSADALGPEDLMIMKCFAGRDKDRPHARALIRRPDFDVGIVDRHLSTLSEKRYPGAERAADYFDDLRDEVGA
jgi:hypothetical protein